MEKQDNSLQEMQLIEQNLQNLLLQKQSFQMELSETQAASKEIDNSGGDVFKIIGQLMIKSDPKKMKEELTNKEKMLEIRISTLEKQEDEFSDQLTKLRDKLIKKN